MSLRLVGATLLLCISASCLCLADQAMQAEDLIRYFAASCPSRGPWTKIAFDQARSIVESLKSIKDDPSCRTVGGALQEMQNLSQRVNEINAQAMGSEINNLRNQEAELLLQLSQTSDPNLSYAITSSLSYIQSTLVSYFSSPNLQAATAIRESYALYEFSGSTQLALNQLAQNQTCLLGHPSLLAGFASMAGAVGSTMIAPGPGLALAAGSDVLNSVVEFARKNSMAKKIKKLSNEMVGDAFSCVIESLSDQWCAAQDGLSILKLKGNALSGNISQDDFFVGTHLLDRELPLFLQWLDKVRAGGDPTNKAEADRQKEVFSRDQSVKTARAYAAGIFNDGQSLFDAAVTNSQKWTVERSLVDKFVNSISGGSSRYGFSMGGDSTTSPLLDVYSASCSSFFLIGLDPNNYFDKIKAGLGDCEPLTSFNPLKDWPVGAPPFVLDLKLVKARALQWVDTADQEVRNELNIVLQPDARNVFQQAKDVDAHGRSPYNAIQHFINFLTSRNSNINDVKSYYMNTAKRLIEIRDQIDKVIAAGEDPTNSISLKAISYVYDKAQLSYGAALFRGRLEQAIRNTLNELVVNGNGGDRQTSALLLASTDVMGEVQRFSTGQGETNFALARFDIMNAEKISENTLGSFVDTFSENLVFLLKGLSGDKKYKDLKASLCLKLMAVPNWPKNIPKDLCINEQVQPFTTGWPSSSRITKATFDLKHEDRACLSRDYFRASKIYQNFLEEKLRH